VKEALQERDLLLLVVDATLPFTGDDDAAVALVSGSAAPVFLVLNKIDRLKDKSVLLPLIARYRECAEFRECIPVSALTGEGLDTLTQEMLRLLPRGPRYFPPDFLTDQPERYLAAELVREKVLELTRQEVPHAVAVLVDEWEPKARLVRIAASIVVERDGQKRILIGSGAAMLKRIGIAAREEIEALLGRKVHLELFVKVRAKWRDNPGFLDAIDWR
jgi:GTP-binding protein Era